MNEDLKGALEGRLAACLPRNGELGEAMAYAVLSGGKRIRPLLLLEAGAAAGTDPHRILPAACAVEAIHQYSLVHDDLPSMDDDDLRRGRPTVHARFGEAMAILTGDALLTWAFAEMASEDLRSEILPEHILLATAILAGSAGVTGMVGGQVRDIRGEGATDPEGVNRLKTGALFGAACAMGGVLGGRLDWEVPLYRFGEELGLQFQAVDDRMDIAEDAVGLTRRAEEATLRAKGHLAPLGERSLGLARFADELLRRTV